MTTSRSGTTPTHKAPSADEDPLDHADREVMVPSTSQPLAAGELLDEDGDDIREYTGEPVETDDGWVVPQAQNTGAGTGTQDEDNVPHKQYPSEAEAERNRELDPPA